MKRRKIVKIIEEICVEEGFDLSLYSDGWLMVIENGERRMFAHGYRFPNNDSAVSDLLNDKSGLSEFLTANGVPCVPHEFYIFNGSKSSSDEEEKLCDKLKSYIKDYGGVVLKPNNGTGGNEVFLLFESCDLHDFVKKYSGRNELLAISPYVKIESEYRSVLCGDEIMFVFEKIRPEIIADGKKSYFDYLREYGITESVFGQNYIPKVGERVVLNWKHNLQGGAKPLLLDNPPKDVINLVEKAREVANVKFASVDIVKVNGEYFILEINSGVMMEKFSSENEIYYNLAKKTYKKAIMEYFMLKK